MAIVTNKIDIDRLRECYSLVHEFLETNQALNKKYPGKLNYFSEDLTAINQNCTKLPDVVLNEAKKVEQIIEDTLNKMQKMDLILEEAIRVYEAAEGDVDVIVAHMEEWISQLSEKIESIVAPSERYVSVPVYDYGTAETIVSGASSKQSDKESEDTGAEVVSSAISTAENQIADTLLHDVNQAPGKTGNYSKFTDISSGDLDDQMIGELETLDEEIDVLSQDDEEMGLLTFGKDDINTSSNMVNKPSTELKFSSVLPGIGGSLGLAAMIGGGIMGKKYHDKEKVTDTSKEKKEISVTEEKTNPDSTKPPKIDRKSPDELKFFINENIK